jgi:hypothetical protein
MSGADLTGTQTLPYRTHETCASDHRLNAVRALRYDEPRTRANVMNVEKLICTVAANPLPEMPGLEFLNNVLSNTTVLGSTVGRG